MANDDFKDCFRNEIYRRTRQSNSKRIFKYFMPKKWYQLFEYCIINKKNNHLKFFSLHIDYKEIWSELRQADKYGEATLINIGFSEEYSCYIVEFQSAAFIDLICSWTDKESPCTKKEYYRMVDDNGYYLDEANIGWLEYKLRVFGGYRL